MCSRFTSDHVSTNQRELLEFLGVLLLQNENKFFFLVCRLAATPTRQKSDSHSAFEDRIDHRNIQRLVIDHLRIID